jgi:hypothetical protein
LGINARNPLNVERTSTLLRAIETVDILHRLEYIFIQTPHSPKEEVPMAKLIGQVLMESGMITIDELNEAIEVQKSSGQRLGDVLINRGVITAEDLQMALEFQTEDEEE